MSALHDFLKITRATLQASKGDAARAVYRSQIVRAPEGHESLEEWMSGKVPLYYRSPSDIAQGFAVTTDFRKPIRDTLLRLPDKDTFEQSHFAEILAGVFAENVLGLRKLYSKLSLLTSENTNAHKMDLVLYDPHGADIEFVFGEVKSSTKCGPNPANHHKGCFGDLFRSFNNYKEGDREFDLAVIQDRMKDLPSEDAQRIRVALQPDHDPVVRFAGCCVIDASTHDDEEASLLLTRENEKSFDVDLVCVEQLGVVASAAYAHLQKLAI